MRKPLIAVVLLFSCKLAFSQCTPANLQASASLNSPNYALNTAFNTSTTTNGVITGLSYGLLNFTGSVGGTARWSGGIQLQNDPTVGNYIFVQPTTTQNTTTTNVATYTIDFTEALYNFSLRIAGLNNSD